MRNAKYCEHCGKLLEKGKKCSCKEVAQKAGMNIGEQGGKKVSKKTMVILAVALVAVIVCGVLLAGKTEKVDLAEYLNTTLDYKGLNGHASADVRKLFDDDDLSSYLLESMDLKSGSELDKMSDKELQKQVAGNAEFYQECENAVEDIVVMVWKNDVEVEKLEELSNGDVIKVEAKSLNPNNKYLKVRFETGTMTFTVKDLMDGQALDAFESADLNVNFTGSNGQGSASLDYKEENAEGLRAEFIFDTPGNNLSNGDKVEVSVRYDKAAWEAKGYFPAEETRTYTVEGLVDGLTSLEQIPQETLDKLQAEMKTSLMSEVETLWYKEISIENITYLGSYLLSKKTGGASGHLYMVYQVDVHEDFSSAGGDDNHFSYYIYDGYERLAMDSKGNVDFGNVYKATCWNTVIRNVKTASGILDVHKDLQYTGFSTLEELFEDCVGDSLDGYTYVTDIQMD